MALADPPITPEQIINIVRAEVFPLLTKRHSAPQGCRRLLTHALFSGLRRVVNENVFAVRHKPLSREQDETTPRRKRNDPERECMWDYVCIRKCDGLLALALESEWSDKQAIVLDDFRKLLYAKASLKVLIYGEQALNRTVWAEMQEMVRAYSLYFAGEQFLIVNLRGWESGCVEALLYESREQGSGVQLVEKRLTDTSSTAQVLI